MKYQVSELIDMILDSFIKRSVTGGLGSAQAEIMADTAVALASANVQLVARKVIGRLCRVLEKTCTSPTANLEQHLMWDDIAILARYLLMLSFNNCLDVARHLPYLFHSITFLVCTGPLRYVTSFSFSSSISIINSLRHNYQRSKMLIMLIKLKLMGGFQGFFVILSIFSGFLRAFSKISREFHEIL